MHIEDIGSPNHNSDLSRLICHNDKISELGKKIGEKRNEILIVIGRRRGGGGIMKYRRSQNGAYETRGWQQTGKN